MRKKIIILLLSGLLFQNIYADGYEVHFSVTYTVHSSTLPGGPKSPTRPLTATLDDHTLTLFYPFGEIVPVELFDEDENVVYTDCFVPGQTSLVFPASFMGEYTIRLTVGSIYYIGVIDLE